MRSILLICLLVGVCAVAAPHAFQTYMDIPATGTAEAAAPTPDAVAAGELAPAAGDGRAVTIKAAVNGHFYVDAEVNFRPVEFIVDTGATVVALRESDAADAGLRVNRGDFLYPVGTANGETMAAEATLASVSVEGIEVRNVRALILPDEQLSVSLLGGSFLHGLKRFEVADGTLIFEN